MLIRLSLRPCRPRCRSNARGVVVRRRRVARIRCAHVLVLGVCSLKGGVGKTSVTLGLASAALERGLRTLVIDLDPQGDSHHGARCAAAGRRRRVRARRARARRRWRRRPSCPRGPTTASTCSSARSAPPCTTGCDDTDVDRLRYALSWVHGYDLVLIDCPPSLGGLTRTGLTACDRAIVVTEPGLFAVMAVGRAMRTIDELRRGPAPALQPLGIVVNRVRARSIEQAFRLEELQTLYGPLVLTPLGPGARRAPAGPGRRAARARVARAPRRPSSARTFDALLDRALRAPRR